MGQGHRQDCSFCVGHTFSPHITETGLLDVLGNVFPVITLIGGSHTGDPCEVIVQFRYGVEEPYLPLSRSATRLDALKAAVLAIPKEEQP